MLIDQAQNDGWDTCVITTLSAYAWLDVPGLIESTGHPVRHVHKLPGEPDVLPSPDAFIIAPATFNTVNKLALGITDTLALGLVSEAIGMRLPVVILPYVNAAQANHFAWAPSVERLRRGGVRVLDREPHEPRHGDAQAFPWRKALEALA